jgi:hypothetical protein
MTTLVIVEKGGTLKELKVKNLIEEELYKKCGFRKNDNFENRTTWDVEINNTKYKIELWARNEGKAGSENKYDFPPPIDKELYFGNCCLVSKDTKNNSYISLSISLWMKIYEYLFGGFEDIEEEEEESEDELDNIPKNMKTKNGYLKDGFVVPDDDDDDDDDNDDYDDDDNDDDITAPVGAENNSDLSDNDADADDEKYSYSSNAGSELSEEPYEYSDED